MAGKIIQIFTNISMSQGHDALADIAKKNGIKVSKIEPGTYVVFVNGKKDKIKIYAASQTIAYCKLEKGRTVDMRVIREIPSVFRGGRMDYDAALSKMLEQKEIR